MLDRPLKRPDTGRRGGLSDGDVDLGLELEVFEPLKDARVFQAFTVSPKLHTVTWPNGADFAPEFLYEKTVGHGCR